MRRLRFEMTGRQEQAVTPVNGHIVERPRLTRLLDATNARAILLVGPAGYGKTVLARQWCETRTHAWVQATPAYADVAAVVSAIAKGVDSLTHADSTAALLSLSRSTNPVEQLETLAAAQVEALQDWPSSNWLVIDEYEWLTASPASESYIRLLIESAPLRLVVTSRVNPTWASARGRVYGDFLIVDRRLLTMDDEEAHRVLAKASPSTSDVLVRAAAGWPAVLGLAATGSISDPPSVVPQLLYEFLAEELFFRSSTELQQALPKLALAPYLTAELATTICGQPAERLLDEASDAGYLTTYAEPRSFHPLLKDFLLTKLLDDEEAARLTSELIDLYVANGEWDNAFHVIARKPKPEMLVSLIECAHEPLLRNGRTVTLKEWVTSAQRLGAHDAVLDLAIAELAAREGRTSEAERHAIFAAHDPESRHQFRAFCLAGRAAHLDNREANALKHFRAAETLAANDYELQEARWGALLCATGLVDTRELQRALDDFLAYEPQTADDLLRAANARLATSAILGEPERAANEGLEVARLIRVANPVVAASFLNALGRMLSLFGRYSEALAITEEAQALAEDRGLAFAYPYVYLAQAIALLGLGSFELAREKLDAAGRFAEEIQDRHNLVDIRTVRARLSLSQQEFAEALALTGTSANGVTQAMEAELQATRALALMCAGRVREAEAILGELTQLDSLPEAAGLKLATEAVRAARLNHEGALRSILQKIHDLGVVDALVVARRASTHLDGALKAETSDARTQLVRKTPGLREASAFGSLTRREREVLQLLGQGHTNREIASTLVIAEVTAKVHVRNILRKLRVRSRTEAAVFATRIELVGARAETPVSATD